MQRFWGAGGGGQKLQYPPSPWMAESLFHVLFPTLRLCNTGAPWDPRESVWWLVRPLMMFNERDCHTNSLFPFGHLGYMWLLSKAPAQCVSNRSISVYRKECLIRHAVLK